MDPKAIVALYDYSDSLPLLRMLEVVRENGSLSLALAKNIVSVFTELQASGSRKAIDESLL